MSMCRPCNVLSTGTVFHRKHAFGNHFTGVRSHDMNTQYPISLCFGQELDESLRIQICLCPRIGTEHELANFVFDSFCFQVLFRLADPGNFRVSVHYGRNGIIVDVPVSGLDVLDGGDAFFLRLVGEHGTEGNVADAFDVLLRSGELIVDDDATSVVELNACSFEVKAFCVWPPANSDENDVGFQLNNR